MSKKILWFDTETTGLTDNAAIVKLAAIIETDNELTEHDFRMRPHEGAEIAPRALEVNGLTMAEIYEYPDPRETYREFSNLLNKHIDRFNKEDKFIPAGKNVSFDVNKLYEWFNRMGDRYLGSYLWGVKLDLEHVLAEMHAFNGERLPNHRLETVAKHYGIEFDAHDAMADIRVTRGLYYRLRDEGYYSASASAREAKLEDGRIVFYDVCSANIDSYSDKFEYIGKGTIYRINGVLQSSTRFNDYHFFKRI